MLTSEELDRREALLRDVARSAGALALQAFRNRKAGAFTLKGRQDYLTEADAAVEQHIRAAIEAAFPDDTILGEEAGGSIGSRLWVIDPIDGTANFARGIAHFCICIAWCEDGRTMLGAIFNPVTDEFYFARRGGGASKNGIALSVSGSKAPEGAAVELGWSARVRDEDHLAVTAGLLAQGFNVCRRASGALALAWVAEGRSDGYAEIYMNAWDCLAGMLMVEEAGGIVGPLSDWLAALPEGGPVLAATPGIAATLAAATGIALAPQSRAAAFGDAAE